MADFVLSADEVAIMAAIVGQEGHPEGRPDGAASVIYKCRAMWAKSKNDEDFTVTIVP